VHPFLDHPGPIPFAHRGGAGEAPENTLVSFEIGVTLEYRYGNRRPHHSGRAASRPRRRRHHQRPPPAASRCPPPSPTRICWSANVRLHASVGRSLVRAPFKTAARRALQIGASILLSHREPLSHGLCYRESRNLPGRATHFQPRPRLELTLDRSQREPGGSHG